MSRASPCLTVWAFVFQMDVLPGRTHVRRCRMIAEFAHVDCRGEVAGKERYPLRDPATKLPRSRGYIDKPFGLH
jgi:hypothetical protein